MTSRIVQKIARPVVMTLPNRVFIRSSVATRQSTPINNTVRAIKKVWIVISWRLTRLNKGSSFFTTNKNLVAVARFSNDGSAHEQPFGKVVLKKGGKIIQTIEINNTEPKGNVLPDSIRRFSVKLDKVGLWGSYTVEGNFGYGSNGQLLSGKTSFFVFPLLFILLGLGLLAVILAMIFALPRAIKRYNANVVRKAGRR